MLSVWRKIYAKYRTDGFFSLIAVSARRAMELFYIQLNHFIWMPIILAVSKYLSRESGLVIFCNTLGYNGNCRYVLDRLIENHSTKVTPYWITHNLSIYVRLKRRNKPVLYLYSPWGVYNFARATVFCVDKSHGYDFPKSATKFKMNHEIPVKFAPQTTDTDEVIENNNSIQNNHYLYPSSFLAEKSGKEQIPTVAPLGMPQNDLLKNPSEQITSKWNEFIGSNKYDFVILYAPTKRKDKYGQSLELFPFNDFELNRLNKSLEELNALLLIRLHPNNNFISSITPTRHEYSNLQQFIDVLIKNDRIVMAGNQTFESTIEILPFTDILITDFSTVYHTFLQLDRPIIFFPYDYESFEQKNGFKYDYFDLLPGPAISSFDELNSYLNIIKNGKDPHAVKRKRLKQLIYDHNDFQSQTRVAEYIEDLANKSDKHIN